MDYQTVLLASPEDVPSPPPADRFAISGISVAFYCVHKVNNSATIIDAIAKGRLREFTDDRSYADKVRPGAGLFYSTLFAESKLPASICRQLQCPHAPSLRQALLWFGDEYLLSVVPIVLSTSSSPDEAVQIPRPLHVDQMLSFLALLADSKEAADLSDMVAHDIIAAGMLPAGSLERTWPVVGTFGIQIWNLDGTDGRQYQDRYKGIRETIEYSWELSALLSSNSDHLIEPGLWQARSPQQVYSHVRSGFAFFDDHMVFVNSDCCLEVAHLPGWLRGRSQYRLENYGYDSSSLFVWSIGVLQLAIISDLGERYRQMVENFIKRTGMSAVEQARFSREKLSHVGLLDRITGFRSFLVEARNRAFDECRAIEQSMDKSITLLNREMDKADTLAGGLLRIHEESAQSRRDAIIATIGVGLAAIQIPGFISQMQSWAKARDWLAFSISLALLFLLILIVPLLWWRRRSN